MVQVTNLGHPRGADALTMAQRGDHVLAVDVGTSAVRVSAVSLAGDLLATARAAIRPEISGSHAVLDATALWSDVCSLLGQLATREGPPIAIGVACQLGTVLADASIDAIGPAFLWQDRRATDEAVTLGQSLGQRAYEIAGRPVAPEQTAARLCWLKRHQPDVLDSATWVLSLKDFIVAKLTGAVVTDPSSASYSLLFDVREGAWSPELLAAAGVGADRLPQVATGNTTAGAVQGKVALDVPALDGLPVAVGGPDGSVAAIGSGAVRAGLVVDVAGTTDVLLHLSDRPYADPEHRTVLNAFVLPGLWAIGGPTGLTGGAVVWLGSVLGHASVDAFYDVVGAAADAIAPGADGVTFHTALSGERFPTWASGASGSIAGLRPEHGAAHLLRAAEEGAAFAVLEGLEVLASIGLDVREVTMAGGVTQRRASMQLRADAWQARLSGATSHESTTVGAAILAAVCGSAFPTVDAAAAAMVHHDLHIEPHEALAGPYRAAFERWRVARSRDATGIRRQDV